MRYFLFCRSNASSRGCLLGVWGVGHVIEQKPMLLLANAIHFWNVKISSFGLLCV